MTENQEKELFNILGTLVTEVREIKSVQREHTQILDKHTQILDKHTRTLDNHTEILERLDAKTDTIAEKVMSHETRLTKAERNIEELQGGVH